MQTKIAVITPFYKGNKFVIQLLECIEKNAACTDKLQVQIEAVIVNDSPDTAVEIPEKEYSFKVRVINHAENGGIHRARVTGLLAAEADYILFLDQDDVVEDCFIKDQLAKIGAADVIVANAWMEYEPGKKRKLYKSSYEFKKVLNKEVYLKSHNMITSPGQCLIKKEAIPKEWCEKIMKVNGSDDLYLWLLMFASGKKFVLNDSVLYTHSFTGENLSADEEKMGNSSYSIKELVNGDRTILSKRDIEVLGKARVFGSKLRASRGINKIICALKNPDIVIPRAWWKARTVISGYFADK